MPTSATMSPSATLPSRGSAAAALPSRESEPSPAFDVRSHLLSGQVIPAHPLALDASRKLSEKHQRALTRYYLASGAGGMAVGVHTTQFAIREHGLYAPVLELAAETADMVLRQDSRPFIKVAGLCGKTAQAVGEAQVARRFGYHAGLLSLGAYKEADDQTVLAHCRAVAEVIPLIGFYLQPAVGGRVFGYGFWREFARIPNVVAIKIAPFNRYQTIDVVRAVVESGRDDIALYTGNDDSIITDLLTRWEFTVDGRSAPVSRQIVGGLLGHWAAWTSKAVSLLSEVKAARELSRLDASWLTRTVAVTDANAALFDAANGFRGCIAGIHEVLRRQGLLPGIWCLDPEEGLSPGQAEEIDRIYRSYPSMNDDIFVKQNIDKWLK
ncbi:MAG: dihydrodipicolinate synthase family protein [Armatimonadota bacterium]